jgi:phosphatidylserine/phosphatidylglycerophosphate/cardiolipin synthase-like enzyme
VVLGSYNFTASAEKRNDENLLIIHDPVLADRFLKEYQRLIE